MYKLKSPIYFLLAFSISFNLIAQSNNLGKKISQKQSKTLQMKNYSMKTHGIMTLDLILSKRSILSSLP